MALVRSNKLLAQIITPFSQKSHIANKFILKTNIISKLRHLKINL